MIMGSAGYTVDICLGINSMQQQYSVSKGVMLFKPFPDVEAVIAAHVDSGHRGGPVLDLNGRVRGLGWSGSKDQADFTTLFMPCAPISVLVALSAACTCNSA